MNKTVKLPLVVDAVVAANDRVVCVDLVSATGETLPHWEAGAHVDVHLPSGLIRQYSLCGDPEATSYRIAVLREDDGRGGSKEFCAAAIAGATLEVGLPRNHFALKDAAAYLLVAGGIGITPILAMARQISRAGRPWKLVYRGASRAAMCFLQEIQEIPGGDVVIVPADEMPRPDIDALIRAAGPETLIYCCGPETLMDGVVAAAESAGCLDRVVMERFTASSHILTTDGDQPFEVQLGTDGPVIPVPADRRLGDVLLKAGVSIPFSCEDGFCGTCETRVLAGIPDHRDTVLSDEDRASGEYMMVCVSRARTRRLTLDVSTDGD